ncbi:nucleoside hydrolase [Actinomadura flavalba]|uniref:nucleoside hydrolase n=1 Tax=Actinomadura flavalba TaxID=1120938 RepID=UPI00037492B1|nr:nucleoside hydrolase [Actinomadura flavalba]
MDLAFDLETQDPDDLLALCLVAGHPAVRLRAVTVTPGSAEQVAFVRRVLTRVGRADVPVGATDPGTGTSHVSGFHHRWLGDPGRAAPDGPAARVLADAVTGHPELTLLTGAALHNLRALLEGHPGVRLARWVAQGGFAGDNVVPPEDRLPKFAGRLTCPTFNFNGERTAARLALATGRITRRELVSKNVTHGVRYDRALHERLRPVRDRNPGLALLHEGMEVYLRKRRDGKLFHDPAAACAAIDPSIMRWAEVEAYLEAGEWGARPAPGSGTFISVAVDRERLVRILAGA